MFFPASMWSPLKQISTASVSMKHPSCLQTVDDLNKVAWTSLSPYVHCKILVVLSLCVWLREWPINLDYMDLTLSSQGQNLVLVWVFAQIGLLTPQALEHFAASFISWTLLCSWLSYNNCADGVHGQPCGAGDVSYPQYISQECFPFYLSYICPAQHGVWNMKHYLGELNVCWGWCSRFHARTTILPAEKDTPWIIDSFKKLNVDFMSWVGDPDL
jgi:hypothetical protein